MSAPRRLARGPVLLVASLASVLALAGCGGSSPSADPSSTPSTAPSSGSSAGGTGTASSSGSDDGTVTYVALGDSYTSAPGLPPTVDAGCARSGRNYPHLIAAADTSVQLDDVSCSGATSADITGPDAGQAAALSPSTDLVTVGIGGNDQGLFITLVGGCTQLAASDPTGAPCTKAGRAPAAAALKVIATDLGQVLDTIHDRAPNAEVLVVGYPRLLPARGSCPDRTPIAPGDYPFVTSVNQRLDQVLQRAAAQHGDHYVDVFGPSRGHDICSQHPWVNGATTASDGVIPYHPFAAEQRAVAALVARSAAALR